MYDLMHGDFILVDGIWLLVEGMPVVGDETIFATNWDGELVEIDVRHIEAVETTV